MGQERTATETNIYSGSVDSCEILSSQQIWLSIAEYRGRINHDSVNLQQY